MPFVIQPHTRIQEWVALEQGYFQAEELAYELEESRAVVPEWNEPSEESEERTLGDGLVREVTRPALCDTYTSADFGFTRHPSAILFAWWDFTNARLVVEDETALGDGICGDAEKAHDGNEAELTLEEVSDFGGGVECLDEFGDVAALAQVRALDAVEPDGLAHVVELLQRVHGYAFPASSRAAATIAAASISASARSGLSVKPSMDRQKPECSARKGTPPAPTAMPGSRCGSGSRTSSSTDTGPSCTTTWTAACRLNRTASPSATCAPGSSPS